MPVRHAFALTNSANQLAPGQTVELWTGMSVAPYYQSPKIGDFTDNGDGQYYIDITSTVKGTVLVNSQVLVPLTNKLFDGDDYGTGTIADGSITEAMLANNSVSTLKLQNQSVTQAKLDPGISLGGDNIITLSNQTFDMNLPEDVIDIGAQGFTNPPTVVAIIPKTVSTVKLISVTAGEIEIGRGGSWVEDTAVFDVQLKSND